MGEQYTLRLLVDDSQVRALEQRLGKMMGMTGSTQGSSPSGGGGLLGGSIGKNIAKLSAIAIGVGSIVTIAKKIQSLAIESSPMLQAIMKLFNTSMLFIFRPIGDFIGFLLRPLMIFFMRNIAIPWYRLAAPIMRQWGSSIGNNLVAFLTDPFGGIINWFEGLDLMNMLGINGFIEMLGGIWETLKAFNLDLGAVGAGISQKFTGAMDRVADLLNPIFGSWVANLRRSFSGVKNFFESMWAGITDTFKPAWDALSSLWKAIADFFKPIFEAIQGIINFFTGGRETGEHTNAASVGAGASRSERGNSGGVTVNIIEPHISNEQELQTFEEKVLDVIERSGRKRFRT